MEGLLLTSINLVLQHVQHWLDDTSHHDVYCYQGGNAYFMVVLKDQTHHKHLA